MCSLDFVYLFINGTSTPGWDKIKSAVQKPRASVAVRWASMFNLLLVV